jgi:hypothetical protein
MIREKVVIYLIVGILLNFVWSYESQAEIIAASSCSQAHVQAAINSASEGDIVSVPAGNCTWTTTPANTPSVSISKSITLKGAGIDFTIITDATGYTYNGNEVAIKITGAVGRNIRISGFTFTGSTYDTKGVIRAVGPSNALWSGLRIDHCRWNFSKPGVVALEATGTYGLVDHCTFDNYGGITVLGLGHWYNNLSFSQPNPAGTSNALYVENCTFNNPVSQNIVGNMDAYDGGNFVFRFNTVINGGIQTHDTAYDALRGVRHYEIYNNNFTSNTTYNLARVIYLRGGTGVLFNNIFSGKYTECIDLNNYRSADTGHNIAGFWGYCNGTNDCDGNASGLKGYPCMDQIGRITDQGSGSASACYQTGAGPGPTQPLEPLYAWNNKCKSSSYNASVNVADNCYNNVCVSDHIKAGRDYYDQTPKPGYTPYPYPHPLAIAPGAPLYPR